MQITTPEQYAAVVERIQELTGALEDTPEEQELIALVAAVEAWHAAHDL